MKVKLTWIALLTLVAVISAACGSFAEPVPGSATLTHEAEIVADDAAHGDSVAQGNTTPHEAEGGLPLLPTVPPVTPTPTVIVPTETPTQIPPTEVAPTEVPATEAVAPAADAYTMTSEEEDIVFFIQEFSDLANGQALFTEQRDVAMAGDLIGFWACADCHSATSDDALTGPGLKSLATREGERIPGMPIELYTYYSIIHPNDYVVEGFEPNVMPIGWLEVLGEQGVYDVASYILSLNEQ